MISTEDDWNCFLDITDIFELSDTKTKYVNKVFQKTGNKMYDYNCDIKLIVGNETFKAHKNVLTNASDYFSAMFSHDMQEKQNDILELKEISSMGFSAMIEYFYHGYITLDEMNVSDILEAARFFHIVWLILVCKHYFIHYLSVQNYDTVLYLSDIYSMDVDDIKRKIIFYLSDNFKSLSLKSSFFKLSKDLLLELLNGNFYIEASEKDILLFVQKWINYDLPIRKALMLTLYKSIKYHLLELNDLDNLDENITSIEEIKSLIINAKRYLSNPSRQCLFPGDQYNGRGSHNFFVMYSGIDDDVCISYKLKHTKGILNENFDCDFMSCVFEFTAVASLGNFLFFAGGYERGTWCSSKAFYSYNPSVQQWVQLSMMNQARVSFSLCSHNNLIYAVAGVDHVVLNNVDKETILDSVEFYDPANNSWSIANPLPYGCYNMSVASMNGKLYLSGGISDNPELNVPTNNFYFLDHDTSEWMELPPMNVARHSHAMVSKDDKLFVFGGFMEGNDTMNFDNCHHAEIYDMFLGQWSLIDSICNANCHIYSISCVFEHEIYLVGGPNRESLYLYSFDEENKSIKKLESCNPYVNKIITMNIPMPNKILDDLSLM